MLCMPQTNVLPFQKRDYCPFQACKRRRHSRVIGQKELVKKPATLVESSVAGLLSSLKQDEGWTKRVGEKCFKPLIYKAFLCLHLP